MRCSGAAGLGDLGRQFPAGPETPAGIASAELLRAVLGRVVDAGYRPSSLDLTIVAARPRLAGHLDEMRLAIAGLVGLDADRVNVKASTGNLEGWEGAGRGISATAVASRRPGRPAHRSDDRSACSTRSAASQRELVPLEPGHVRIYSCGPTVYGPAHIGNFRSFLFADLLVRYLRYRGLRVTWVMNITDIDDKIIRGAAAQGISIGELAQRWTERFLADAAALRMTPPDVLPRATEHIAEIVALIATLLERGTPIGPTTARSSSGSPPGRPTGGWPGSTRTSSGSASGSRPTSTARTTSATSPCGRGPSRASRPGRRRSARAGRAGTSSARR